MEYIDYIEQELQLPHACHGPLVLDLFAGCGGLALGFEAAGFRTVGYEMLEDACMTYRTNLTGECRCEVLKPGHELDFSPDVIIGGPPCQPFSVNGLQSGQDDSRNGFPAFLSIVQRYPPKIVIFENVRGMLYKNRAYFDSVLDSLENLGYSVCHRLLNAVNYGVPQKRERLFVVAHKGNWRFPEPCCPNGKPFTAGDAIGDLAFKDYDNAKFLTPSMDEYVGKYERKSKCIRPRDVHLNEPCRTVTCRNLNGATGDMLRVKLPDGKRRRLTPREGARLQSFPDWFTFHGSEGSQFNQIGNAVPPLLGKTMADSVKSYLSTLGEAQCAPVRRPRQYILDFARTK